MSTEKQNPNTEKQLQTPNPETQLQKPTTWQWFTKMFTKKDTSSPPINKGGRSSKRTRKNRRNRKKGGYTYPKSISRVQNRRGKS